MPRFRLHLILFGLGLRHRIFTVFLFVSASATIPASGFFLDELQGGLYAASLGAGGATAWEPMACGQNPASAERMGFGGYLARHSPFGMSGIGVTEGGLHLGGGHWGGGLGFLQTQVEDLYREQTLEAQVSLGIGPITLGGTGALRHAALPDELTQTLGGDAIGFTWRPFPALVLGGFCRNLASRKIWTRELEPILQLGFRVREGPPVSHPGQGTLRPSLAFDIRRGGNSKWRALVAHSLDIGSSLTVTAGLANRPFQFSVGASLSWSSAKLHYARRSHSALGSTDYPGLAFQKGGAGVAQADKSHAP